MTTKMYWIGLGVLVIAAVAIIVGLVINNRAKESPADPNAIGYEAVDPSVTVSRLAQDLGPITRLKIAPDGQLMLAGLLTGDVYAFSRVGDSWQRQAQPILQIKTAFPGFPPEENGLAGIAFGADYATSGDVFFTYAFRGDTIRNRVARATIRQINTSWTVSDFIDIFEANVETDSSHQIQGIEGVVIEKKPHVVFLVGEGFQAKRARDLTLEAGKLMLIQRDGTNPLGARPYPAQPKLQAIGIRNAPDLAVNIYDPVQRLAIVDTGPDSYDRFIYGNLLETSKGVQPADLGWDGTTESLQADRLDANTAGSPNMVLDRWDPTRTATNIVFHPGKGVIPASIATETSLLVSFFGRTGETGAGKLGREILLGRLTLGAKPSVSWQPFIRRSPTGVGQVGHPLALERDPLTNNLVFADIMEGAIYTVTIND